MKTFLVLFFLPLCVACVQIDDNELSRDEYGKALKQTILIIPDSLLTCEQLELKIRLLDIIYENVYVEDNNIKLSAEKELFKQSGIPSVYYDVINYQLEEASSAVKRWKSEQSNLLGIDLETLLQEAKERYWNFERELLINRSEYK